MSSEKRFTGPNDPNIIPPENAFAEMVELAKQRGVIKYRYMNESIVFHLQEEPDSTMIPWIYARLNYHPGLPDHITINNQLVGEDGHYSTVVNAREFTKKYVGGNRISQWIEVAYVTPEEIEGMQFSRTGLESGTDSES